MATQKESEDLARIGDLLQNLGAKLNAVSSSVNSIKTSIVNKGVEVPEGTKLSDYDTKIDAITTDEPVDYTEVINTLTSLGTTLDTINGEVITASAGSADPGIIEEEDV